MQLHCGWKSSRVLHVKGEGKMLQVLDEMVDWTARRQETVRTRNTMIS